MDLSILLEKLSSMSVLGMAVRKERIIRRVLLWLSNNGFLERTDDRYVFTDKIILYVITGTEKELKELTSTISKKRAEKIIKLFESVEERKKFMVEAGANEITKELSKVVSRKITGTEKSVVKAVVEILLEHIEKTTPDKYKELDNIFLKLLEEYTKWIREALS